MRRNGFFLFLLQFIVACSQSADNREPPAELTDFKAKARVQQVWSRELGAIRTIGLSKLAPYIANGNIFAAGGSGRLAAYDLANGAEVWKVDLARVLSAGVGGFGEQLYVATPEGDVIAVSAMDGKSLWQAQVSSEILAAPVASQNVVVVRSGDGRISAFSADRGDRLWTFVRDVPALSLRGSSKPILAGGAVFVGLDNGRFIALDQQTGALLWEQVIASPSGRSEVERLVDIDGDAVRVGDILFVATYQGRVVQLSARNGDLGWTRDMSSNQALNLDDRRLYVTDDESQVWALDLQSGASLWKQSNLRLRRLTAAVPANKYLVAGDFAGYIHWLSRFDGDFVARRKIDDTAIMSPPVDHNGLLYVQSLGGKLAALRLKEIAE